MRTMGWIVLAALTGLGAGLWFALHSGLGGGGDVDRDVPPALVALHGQLLKDGVVSKVGLVRREHSDVRARAIFTIHNGSERVFLVLWCTSDEAARKHVRELKTAARPSLPEANGPFVIQLTDWSAADPLTSKVLQAFRSFDVTAAEAPAGR